SPKRLEMARKYGADHYFLSEDPDIEQKVKDVTGGEGPDVIMVTCASPEAQEQSLKIARHRARINFFGGLASTARNLNIPSNLIHYQELVLLGSHGSLPRHHQKAVKMISQGMVHAGNYITHRFPLDRVQEAYRASESREGLKVVVNP
ncbi:MAG: zinc-binding dehydrogenase, partial [Atribacterota bacterium]